MQFSEQIKTIWFSSLYSRNSWTGKMIFNLNFKTILRSLIVLFDCCWPQNRNAFVIHENKSRQNQRWKKCVCFALRNEEFHIRISSFSDFYLFNHSCIIDRFVRNVVRALVQRSIKFTWSCQENCTRQKYFLLFLLVLQLVVSCRFD